MSSQNVEPLPSSLSRPILPASIAANSLLMVRPSPLPADSRVIDVVQRTRRECSVRGEIDRAFREADQAGRVEHGTIAQVERDSVRGHQALRVDHCGVVGSHRPGLRDGVGAVGRTGQHGHVQRRAGPEP